MDRGFWDTIQKPLIVQAPMADVTDAAFRQIIARYGKPDVMWTEFVSCDGLCSRGKDALLPDFWFSESERPIVAQIFGGKPEHFTECVKLIRDLGFDGVDINMGCPDRSVEKQGAGANLIKDPKRAQDIIFRARETAGDMPVSVKTRIGYQKKSLEVWLPALIEAAPAVITIHARTRNEMSLVPAQWDALRDAVEIVKTYTHEESRPLIIGNGDVSTVEEAREKAQMYGLDGVMIGRGMFGTPWLFAGTRGEPAHIEERMRIMLEHTFLYEALFSHRKRFDIMKKHFKAYILGFDGARELRGRLMEQKNAEGVFDVVKERFPLVPNREWFRKTIQVYIDERNKKT